MGTYRADVRDNCDGSASPVRARVLQTRERSAERAGKTQDAPLIDDAGDASRPANSSRLISIYDSRRVSNLGPSRKPNTRESQETLRLAGTGTRPDRRVAVVDDDAMVRRWIRESLVGSGYVVAGEASTRAEAESLVARRAADVLLVDYWLGDTSALDFVRELRRKRISTPVLIFTASPIAGLNEVVLEAGAQGCLVKTGNSCDLLSALHRVCSGGSIHDPRNGPRQSLPTLTTRERDVLRLISNGKTNGEAALTLMVSLNTVKTLQARASAKLGTARRTETVVVAKDLGLLD
jgi:two-component system nitrate/nitrite response regulator NarL